MNKRLLYICIIALFLFLLLSINMLAQDDVYIDADELFGTQSTQIPQTQINDNTQTYTFITQNNEGVIVKTPNKPMFWEHPSLNAGQLRQGLLTIENTTDEKLDFSLSYIDLPYENSEAMLYLSALRITIKTFDDEILYDGAYSDIGGKDKLDIASLEPSMSKQYLIKIDCPFDYEGQTYAVTHWNFRAGSMIKPEVQRNDNTLKIVLGVSGLFLIMGALLILHFLRIRQISKL